ncbi:MAG: hydroxymethylpyrimidine/phosphomethylpyrimidine kinase [Candidatus Methylumidiphilus sp.]
MPPLPPIVLSLSGHDPTGGAGVQADIETLSRLGCHPCTVITALTAQDTRNVRAVWPQRPEDFLAQARLLAADLPVKVVKIGLLGSAPLAEAVAALLKEEWAGMPVVLDPVLAAGGGHPLARADLLAAIREALLPLTTVLTPNIPEARQLAGRGESPEAWAEELLRLGCDHVLITGAHAEETDVVNRLYGPHGPLAWHWPRLPREYHGSGCTLAAALAAGLAQGLNLADACSQAQQFTWDALAAAVALGRGQWLPRR